MKKLLITLTLAAAAFIPALADSRIWREVDIEATNFTDLVPYMDPETGGEVWATRYWYYPYDSIHAGSTIGKSKKAVLSVDSIGGWKVRKLNQQVSLTWATVYYCREWVWIPNPLIPIAGGSYQIRTVPHYGTAYTTVIAHTVDKTSEYVPPVPEQ